MSIHFNAHLSNENPVLQAQYLPARTVSGDHYEVRCPANVAVQLGADIRISMRVDQARVLLATLGEAVALHDDAYRVELVKTPAVRLLDSTEAVA